MKTSLADSNKSQSILIVAAEASSCMYAKSFMEEWQSRFGNWDFFGIGDQEMSSMGMDCQGYAEELAVVGLFEALTHWSEISQAYKSILKKAEEIKPTFALLLDYPGFNLRLATDLRKLDIPVAYYISPQLWAWKKGRVHRIRRDINKMMVVFPFEVDFYKKYGVEAKFVGHPLLEVVEKEKTNFHPSDVIEDIPTLGLMPGSRKSEIRYNLNVQKETAIALQNEIPHLRVKVLVAPTLNLQWLKNELGARPKSWVFEQSSPTTMILGCDFILTASGTATLQVALCERPMVVMYKMNPVTAFLARLLVRSVDAFCIVNLIAGEKIVPEYFQNQASVETLKGELKKLLIDKSFYENRVHHLKRISQMLGKGKATANVVDHLSESFGVQK